MGNNYTPEEKRNKIKLARMIWNISNDSDFVFGVLHFAETEDEMDKLMDFIGNHPNADEHEILFQAVANSVDRINAER